MFHLFSDSGDPIKITKKQKNKRKGQNKNGPIYIFYLIKSLLNIAYGQSFRVYPILLQVALTKLGFTESP